MGFYENLRDKTAAPLIRKYGQPITLTIPSGAFDPVTGKKAPAVPATYPGYAVEGEYTVTERTGTQVLEGDKRLYCVDIPEPAQGQTITVGRAVYKVVRVAPLSPGGVSILFDVQVRK